MSTLKTEQARTGNGNGKSDERWSREHREELRTQVALEFKDLRAGKEENTVVLTALANQWSADQLREVARRRGKNWRFLTALTDQILQAEGWALLGFAATATGVDMSEYMMRKVFAALDRVDGVAEEYESQGLLDARRVQHMEAHKDFLEELVGQGRRTYFERVGRMMSGGDGYDF